MIVVVDWSAASSPTTGRDSIWIHALDVAAGDRRLVNPRTRRDAERWLVDLLADAPDRRVLVGIDIALGFPAGFAACLSPEASLAAGGDQEVGERDRISSRGAWHRTWAFLRSAVRDDERNRNNRFEVAASVNARVNAPGGGPFWGCPPAFSSATLDARKRHALPVHGRGGLLAEFRLSERRLRDAGRRPFSVWQVAYTGSVGGQTLVGIPAVDRVITHPALEDRAVVWPLDTGLVRDPTGGRADAVVVAEVWPGLVTFDATRHPIRDAAQVLATAEHLARLDDADELATLFAPQLPAADATVVVAEEGWILGA